MGYHRDWIEKALAGVDESRRNYQQLDILPQSIVLKAVDTTWGRHLSASADQDPAAELDASLATASASKGFF